MLVVALFVQHWLSTQDAKILMALIPTAIMKSKLAEKNARLHRMGLVQAGEEALSFGRENGSSEHAAQGSAHGN